jgi:serine/threonine protein kinase
MTNGSDPDRILAACLQALEEGDFAVVDRACEDHPNLAEKIRATASVFRALEGAGKSHQVEEEQSVPKIPKAIGRFEIHRVLGQGGSGLVFLAHDPELQRLVALKTLPLFCAVNRRRRDRFRREARILARLRHPNVVPVHEVGESGGIPYLVMEYVQGKPLDMVLKEARERCGSNPGLTASASVEHLLKSLGVGSSIGGEGDAIYEPGSEPQGATVGLCLQITQALQHCHQAGIIHRDVKPANVLVKDSSEACLVDFGVARDQLDLGLTSTGEFLGTPYYCAPEQVDSAIGPVDERTDVYGVGATLFEMLTLSLPARGSSQKEIFHSILNVPPPRPRRVDAAIPRNLETVCLRALAKRPDDRYMTMEALESDLQRSLRAERPGQLASVGLVRVKERLRQHRSLLLLLVMSLLAGSLLLKGLVGPSTGLVIPRGDLQGVRLSINGEHAEIPPDGEIELPPGSYMFVLRREGKVPEELEVEVTPGGRVEFPFEFEENYGHVHFQSYPPGARLRFRDELGSQGVLDHGYSADLLAGWYEVSLREGEFQMAVDAFELFPGSNITLEAFQAGKAVPAKEVQVEGRRYKVKETRVNQFTPNQQESPRICLLKSGDLVVVWASRDQIQPGSVVLGRVFDAGGRPRSGEFRLSSGNFPDWHYGPVAAPLLNGGFAVVWGYASQSALGALFDSRWQPVGQEFRVFEHDCWPVVAPLPNGGFLAGFGERDHGFWATWFNGEGEPVRRRRFAAGPIHEPEWLHYHGFAVAAQKDGSVMTAWLDEHTILLGQWLDEDGRPLGPARVLSSAASGALHRRYPSVVYAGNDGVVVVWHGQNSIAEGWQLYAKIWRGPKAEPGREFLISEAVSARGASGASSSAGEFVISWEANGDGPDVLGRILDGSLDFVGEPFEVNQFRPGKQTPSDTRGGYGVVFAGSSMAFVWQGRGPLDSTGIYLTIFTPLE